MKEKVFDLSWEITGDHIRLEQDDGCGEVNTIDLHTAQLKLLTERAGIVQRNPRLESLVRLLVEKLIEFQDALLDQRDYDPETWLRIPAVLDIAGFLHEEITGELPFAGLGGADRNQSPKSAPMPPLGDVTQNVTSDVTQTAPSEARKAEAMTNAERQQAYRDRKSNEQPVGTSASASFALT